MAIVNLIEVKTAIKDLLDRNNAEMASPRDLSENMSSRIKKVFKVNPDLHTVGSSQLPAVTIWIDNKNPEPASIGVNQTNVKRRAKVDIKIAGLVFNQNFLKIEEDPAAEDVENLMENIEQILRTDPELNKTVIWQFPTSISYFTFRTQEESHYRVGEMTLEATVFY